MKLFDEIYELARSVSCTDSNELSYTPYGAKACGGPKGYIGYSNNIDTITFLNLVDQYTSLEGQHNTKWGIISACNVTPQPESVECQNGVPRLKY